jgi:uncharacterized DUF497 family protein
MEFEWDAQKAQSNVVRHRIHFRQAIPVFFDPFRLEDKDRRYVEERFRLIGQAHGRVLFVVYTWRSDTIRIISARKATKDERERYYKG